jgi:hypothetical protein
MYGDSLRRQTRLLHEGVAAPKRSGLPCGLAYGNLLLPGPACCIDFGEGPRVLQESFSVRENEASDEWMHEVRTRWPCAAEPPPNRSQLWWTVMHGRRVEGSPPSDHDQRRHFERVNQNHKDRNRNRFLSVELE